VKKSFYFYAFIFYAVCFILLAIYYTQKRIGYLPKDNIEWVFASCLGCLLLMVVNAVGWKSKKEKKINQRFKKEAADD
jgi:presenilin-like A22 family membrane protease